jgi:hypothetical protein
MNFAQALKRARCRELDWLCCIPRERLPAALEVMQRATIDDLYMLQELACACQAGTGMLGGQGQGQPSTGPKSGQTCIDYAIEVICSPPVQTLAAIALGKVRDARRTETDSWTIAALMAIETLLMAMLRVCLDHKLAKETVIGLCHAQRWLVENNPLTKLYAKLLGDLIARLLTSGPVHMMIERCCDEMVSTVDTVPSWALDIEHLAKKNETSEDEEG